MLIRTNLKKLITIALIMAIGIFLLGFINVHHLLGINRVNIQDKVVALTYDDGPHPLYTRQLLALLDRYQAKATFFQVGRNLLRYPEIARLALAQGHELANHSFSHQDLLWKKYKVLKSEVESTDYLLQQTGVNTEIYFRPPWGRRFIGLIWLLYQKQKKMIIWDVNSEDYVKSYTAAMIANKVIREIRPGSIVLMHDGGKGDRTKSIEASEIIIKTLKQKGYQFQTVNDLLKNH